MNIDQLDFSPFFEGRTVGERCEIQTKILEKLSQAASIPHAVACVKWVPISQIVANDYNPNQVASTEMKLLYTSIKHDSYTQPIVVSWDDHKKKYVVIDGFHRYSIMVSCPDIAELTEGHLPVVVLKKSLSERMAATVRHNRARGTHSIHGMSDLVFRMLREGCSDVDICNELGLEAEELVRLKYITGYAKLYKNVEYSRAWAFNSPKSDSSEIEKDVESDGGFECNEGSYDESKN